MCKSFQMLHSPTKILDTVAHRMWCALCGEGPSYHQQHCKRREFLPCDSDIHQFFFCRSNWNESLVVVVPKRASFLGLHDKLQTAIKSQTTIPAFSLYIFVCCTYINSLSPLTSLTLPVTASRQALFTQHLLHFKSLIMSIDVSL